jgi:replicative DNA helicase
MASVEDLILTKILEGREPVMAQALSRGLKEEFFKSGMARSVFSQIMVHWTSPSAYGTLPSIQQVLQRHPGFSLATPTQEEDAELIALIDFLKMSAMSNDVIGVADMFKALAIEDPVNALAVTKKHILDVESRYAMGGAVSGMSLHDIANMAHSHYASAQEGSIYGIPWPWKCLTEDTLGKRGGDFVVFYGRMKSMKTWILLYCAAVDFLNHNKRVLVWSKEMSKEKLGLRMASLLSRVDYQLFKKGLLPPKVHQRCFEVLDALTESALHVEESLESRTRDLMLLAGIDAPKTLEGLKSVVTNFEPDVIYLDSFYHMDTARSQNITTRWHRVATVAEDVKAYAEDVKLPIIAVHQANRAGEKTFGNTLADLADADVIAREADLVIRVLKDPESSPLEEDDYEEEFRRIERNRKLVDPRLARLPRIKLGNNDPMSDNFQLMTRLASQSREGRVGGKLALVLGGNREGVLEAFTINATPSYNFDLIDDHPSREDIKKWTKIDDTQDDLKASKRKAKPKGKSQDSNIVDATSWEGALAKNGMKA